jgi:threonylcarbamoyladenosine tRNA methylthiotransferase MtaB
LKFFLKTYGCKVNQYETQVIREGLLSKGHEETDDILAADLCFINTCTVTAKADKECRDIIRRIKRKNPGARIIASGCYVESDSKSIKAIGDSIEILPNSEKFKLAGVNSISSFKGHTRAFIKVQDGCNNFCSYCVIPYTRGRSRSRVPEDILKESALLIRNGYKELVLTGICLGDFGKDIARDVSLASMVSRIAKIEGDYRIRLSSIELKDVTEELIGAIRYSDKICNHLHIPLQSGDDEILYRMNRKYKAQDFIEKVSYIRSLIPDIGITTDIIVGFPGESELNFQNTVEVIKKIKPVRAHIFSYSPRKPTKAFIMPDAVTANEKLKRYKIAKSITDQLALKYSADVLTAPQKVLIEHRRDRISGMLTGYTGSYIKVVLQGNDNLMGTLYTYIPAQPLL